LALRYKRPILILRLQKDIELPFRLRKRQWIDLSGNFKAGMAKLRQAIHRLDSADGQIQILKDRLAEANRDLPNAKTEGEKSRILDEIYRLDAEIKAHESFIRDPEKSKKLTRKNINVGLESDRQPLNPTSGKETSRFINPRPGSIPDYFEGRLIETEEIADFLSNDFQRIMTITGRAGSGKTALVCRVLQSLQSEQFPNDLGELKIGGIVYLSEIGNYKINVANIFSGLLQLIEAHRANRLEALYREAKVPVDEKIRALVSALPAEPVIVLLDNFEDLLDSNDLINDYELHTSLKTILEADAHRLKVLITTRVLPRQLSMIEPARQFIRHLEEGLPSPFAENILRKMDKDGRAGFRDADEVLLGRVREVTLGYPRALESLYAILRVDRYSSVDELLVEGLPETVVEKFVGEAFSRLDMISQKILQTLAVYNRPVSYAAVDFALQFHIPGVSSAPVLERLVSMHFVRREAKRYFLHPADRDYALSRMHQGDSGKKIGQGARARTWDQHSLTLRAADYFVEVRKPRDKWINLDDLAAQLAEFELRCAADDYDGAGKVLVEFDRQYLSLWGHYHLMITLHERILDSINNKDLLVHVLNGLETAYRSIGDVKKAITYLKQGLEITKDIKDRGGEGVFLGNLGNAYTQLGEARKAINYYEEALFISRQAGDRKSEENDLGSLGNAYAELGEPHKAINYYEQALVISRKIGERRDEGTALGNLGNAHAFLGALPKAIEDYKQALAISRQIGDRRGEGNQLSNLGGSYIALGDTRKALECFEQSLRIALEIGDRRGEANVLGNLGNYYAVIDKTGKEIEYFQQALGIAREISDRRSEAMSLGNMGRSLLRINEYQASIETIMPSIHIADDISYLTAQNEDRWGLAQVYLFQNDWRHARSTIEEALQYDVPQNNHNVTALHGIIVLRQGERETAREAFTKSIAQADEILAKTSDYYNALDAKGLALCGLVLCRSRLQRDIPDREEPSRSKRDLQDVIETFRKARKIAPHAGIVKSVLRLFDELVKCDEERILKDVRSAVEGKA
jgi:tetratricopeptide (TPR) repeat protein